MQSLIFSNTYNNILQCRPLMPLISASLSVHASFTPCAVLKWCLCCASAGTVIRVTLRSVCDSAEYNPVTCLSYRINTGKLLSVYSAISRGSEGHKRSNWSQWPRTRTLPYVQNNNWHSAVQRKIFRSATHLQACSISWGYFTYF